MRGIDGLLLPLLDDQLTRGHVRETTVGGWLFHITVAHRVAFWAV